MGIISYATFLAICFGLCCNSINSVSGDIRLKNLTEESEEIAYQKLLKMEKGMQDSIKKLVNQALPMLMNSNSSIELSGPCMGSILKMIGAMKKMRLWPFQMLDAIGKPPGGVLSGTASALGSYKQCVDIVIPTITKNRKPDVGQYCIVDLSPPLPPKPRRIKVNSDVFQRINATFETEMMKDLLHKLPLFYKWKFTWGVCLPSTCTIDDLEQVLVPISSQTGFNAAVRSCEIKEPLIMDTVHISIVSTLCVFIMINILSTLVHEVQLYRREANNYNPSKDVWFTVSSYFSIRQNFVKLMRTREATPRSLDALNGIKFVTMTWIVLCHSYLFNDPRLLRESSIVMEYPKDLAFQVVANGFLSVSTFFFLAAVLLAYNVVKRHDAGTPLNPFILFFRRCYRFTPVLLLITGTAILRPLYGSGPLFKEHPTERAAVCRKYWWINFLFIQNYYYSFDFCEDQTWYLAVDVQCFIIGLLYLFILFKNEVMAKWLLILATLASCAGTGFVYYINDFLYFDIVSFIDREFLNEHLRNTHASTYQYIGLYSVGLFLGTYMARSPKIHIKKFITVICWIVSFAVGLTIVYSVHPWNSGKTCTMLEAICYSSLKQLGWALAVGWVVLACFSGRGGVANSLLSWPGFQPLVKLSYIVYMIHIQVYQIHNDIQQGLGDATHIAFVVQFLACLVIAHILAVFIRVMYEYPLLKIEDDACKWLQSRQAAKEKGPDMSVDLYNNIALSSEIKNEDVKVQTEQSQR